MKTPEEILQAAGFGTVLCRDGWNTDVEAGLRAVGKLASANGCDAFSRESLRTHCIDILKQARIPNPRGLLDAALLIPSDDKAEPAPDPEPWSEEVGGSELLDELLSWIRGYVHLGERELEALTLWTAATWFVQRAYFAPILILESPTKRSGKTLVLDLLRWTCRRAKLTSGTGITAAVVFRLNEERHPTFLIDEAEKLSGRNADRDIISLLNAGYRRGATVDRCRESKGDGFVVEEFDAFGFRALAAIGSLWDTLLDRSVLVKMKRKPREVKVRRFEGRCVEEEGKVIARKLARFSESSAQLYQAAEKEAPRPEWLNDRECDNWSPLFAVAALAGRDWTGRALEAAKHLAGTVHGRDLGETLLSDLRATFEKLHDPEVIQSGELVQQLNRLEESPWGDFRKGEGLSTHKLAGLLRPFGVRPRQERTVESEKVRGYWRKDFESLFSTYAEVGQVGQPNNDAGFRDSQSGTGDKGDSTKRDNTNHEESITSEACPSCPTSSGEETDEKPVPPWEDV